MNQLVFTEEGAMLRRWLLVPILAVALFVTVGCATKGFVRQEVQQRDMEIGRLDSSLGQTQTRIDDVGKQVGEVRSRTDDATRRADQATSLANDAGQRADAANSKAGQALSKALDTDTRFTRAWQNRNKRTVAETVLVRFRFNKWSLDDRAQTELLNAVKLLRENPNVVVSVEGFTDRRGPAEYNLELSQRRADAVRRFLVQQGVDLHRIQSIGLGELPVAKGAREPAQSQRIVTVQLMMPAE
jgi:outer membrane protein OmpA-like peptidoglycan-associated protein